jgi:hypothetical protein
MLGFDEGDALYDSEDRQHEIVELFNSVVGSHPISLEVSSSIECDSSAPLLSIPSVCCVVFQLARSCGDHLQPVCLASHYRSWMHRLLLRPSPGVPPSFHSFLPPVCSLASNLVRIC